MQSNRTEGRKCPLGPQSGADRIQLNELTILCRNLIKIVGPPLHHFPAFRQVLRMVVSSAHIVPFTMGKLTFNHIRTKTVLVQNRAGGAAKSMPSSA